MKIIFQRSFWSHQNKIEDEDFEIFVREQPTSFATELLSSYKKSYKKELVPPASETCFSLSFVWYPGTKCFLCCALVCNVPCFTLVHNQRSACSTAFLLGGAPGIELD